MIRVDHLPPAPYIAWGKGGSRRQRLVIVIEGGVCDSRAALSPGSLSPSFHDDLARNRGVTQKDPTSRTEGRGTANERGTRHRGQGARVKQRVTPTKSK